MLVAIVLVVAGCGGGNGSKIEKYLASRGRPEQTCRSAGMVAFGEGRIQGYECYDPKDASLEHRSSAACYAVVDGQVEHLLEGRCRGAGHR